MNLKVIAIPLALLEIQIFFIKPLLNEMKNLKIVKSKLRPSRVLLTLTCFAALIFALCLPWSFSHKASAYISAEQLDSTVRAQTSGYIKEITGTEIILSDPMIDKEFSQTSLDIEYLKRAANGYRAREEFAMMQLQESLIQKTILRLKVLKSRKAKLIIPYTGVIINKEKLIGRFVNAGEDITELQQNSLHLTVYIEADKYDESLKSGLLYLKHQSPIAVNVVDCKKQPQSRIPASLAAPFGDIHLDAKKRPLLTYYLLTLQFKNECDCDNARRSGVFVYQKTSTPFKSIVKSITSFLRKELM